jgi:hypothetical protein
MLLLFSIEILINRLSSLESIYIFKVKVNFKIQLSKIIIRCENMTTNYGNWAFIVGVVLAIVLGLFGTYITTDVQQGIAWLLIILGLIVGFVNIGQKEAFNFLIAAIALLAVGAAGLETLPVVGDFVGPILTNIATFVAPAAVIIALKAIYDLAYRKK